MSQQTNDPRAPASGRTALRDLIVVGVVTTGAYLTAAALDAGERLHRLLEPSPGRYLLEEMSIVFGALALGLAVFSLLRWRGHLADRSSRAALEARYRKAEERYRTLVEQLPSITYIEDAGTSDYLYLSPQVTEVFGYTPEEWAAPGVWRDRIHPEDRDRVLALDALTNETLEPYECEYRVRAKDGREVWVDERARVLRNDDGTPRFWLGVQTDITERKQAERRLRDAEERYRTLVEQLPAAVYVELPDEPSTAVYVSPHYEQVTGYTVQERIDDPGLWLRSIHPDDLDRVKAENERTNLTGEPFQIEYRMVRKDGGIVWVRDEARLVGGSSGGPRLWQGVLLDITEQKLAEEDVRRREAIVTAVGFTAQRFLMHPAWESGIDEVLEQLGEAAAVHRVCVYENERAEDGGIEATERHEWTAPGIAPTVHLPSARFRYEQTYGRWARLLGSGEIVRGITSQLPAGEREGLEVEGVLSLVAVPVFVGDQWWGYVAFDDCLTERAWTAAEIDALHAAADMLGTAIQRQRAETRLAEAETRFRTLVEQLPAVTFIATLVPGAPPLYVSPQYERFYGYRPEERLSEPGMWNRLLHPADRDRVLEEFTRATESSDSYSMEYRMIARDGGVVWTREEGVLVRDAAGAGRFWQGIMLDVTEQKRTEEQLRETETRFRTLVEQLPAVTYVDSLGDPPATLYISPQVEQITGYGPEAWKAEPRLGHRITHPDDRDRVVAESRRADLTGEPFNVDYRIIARDGRVVWIHEEAQLLRDDHGSPRFWQGIRYDITERRQAEEQLREAEERYRTLAEQLPMVTYVEEFGSDRTIYMSPQLWPLIGYTPQQWIEDEHLWERILHPADRDRVLSVQRLADETGEDFSEEYRLVASDGRDVWVRDQTTLLRDQEGNPRFWQGFYIDITEQKLAEDRRLEAEARYRTLVETVPAVTYVDTLGDEWETLYVSPQIETLFGYSAEEWHSASTWMEAVHPEDWPRVEEELEEHNLRGSPFDIEYRLRRKSGEYRWVHDQGRIVNDEAGRARYSQGMMFDITERKQGEEQLRRAEERFRVLVEQSPAMLYIEPGDPDADSFYVGPQVEQLFGVTAEDYMADPGLWARTVHPDDRAEADTAWRGRLAAKQPWSIEYRVVHPDGRVVWVRDEATLVLGEDGEVETVQGIIYDITERKLAEQALAERERREREAAERLRALDEMKNTFLAAVSHELRSPLTSILGLALTLEREHRLSDDDRDDLLARLAGNARKLDRLLKDLLDIDRLSRGIIEPQYRLTDLGALVRRTIESLDSTGGRTVMVQTDAVVIPVDPAKVERIVENLLANAMRHTAGDRTIWVGVRARDAGALLSVEDDGPGIPEELKQAIFEPFRQGPSASRANPGTGIGLSLVARFAELHGGRAWVGDREGGGASFNVFLPGTPPGEVAQNGANEEVPGGATIHHIGSADAG